jgi:hypothetical protein
MKNEIGANEKVLPFGGQQMLEPGVDAHAPHGMRRMSARGEIRD